MLVCRRLILAADVRCIQQWLPGVQVSSFTAGAAEDRQNIAEAVAEAVAAHSVLAGESGEDALKQLMALNTRSVIFVAESCR